MTLTSLDEGLALDVLLRDGTPAQVRLVVPSDAEELHALNAGVSDRTRFLRYFTTSDQPGTWYVDRVLASTRTGQALVAVVGGAIVALAGFVRLEQDPTSADLALLVTDGHQVHGVGALLLEHLAEIARARGIRTFTADVLQENSAMLHLLRDSGFTVSADHEGSVAVLSVDLTEVPSVWEAVQRRESAAERASLLPLLRPQSIVVVGSPAEESVATHVCASLNAGGYAGPVFRVDRTNRVSDAPFVPDLVVVAVPSEVVLGVARDAAAAHAKGLLVLSAGFAETGPAGVERQRELLRTCRASGMRLLGPNCLGIVNTDPAVSLNATFCDAQPRPGTMALISQSGAVGIAALRHAERRGAGLSLFVSTGNKADVSGNDLLAYVQDDPRTSVIALYLESFGNARKFIRRARSVGHTKPIVVVKSGRSVAGSQAGQSHTAAAATPDVAVDALLREAGAIRADDLDELFDIVNVLSSGRLPAGRRVAILGNSGGPGVLAADACENAGLEIGRLSEATTLQLGALLPPGASVRNPVDLLATVRPAEFAHALELVLQDPSVDAVLAIYTPLVRGAEEDYATALTAAQALFPQKPLIAAFPGLAWAPSGLEASGNLQVPFFEFPERAVHALGRATAYARDRSIRHEDVARRSPTGAASHARLFINAALDHHGPQTWLPPVEAISILTAYGIPCAQVVPARDVDAAAAAAVALGFPVALKATGPTIVHKADVGGLALDLQSERAVREAFRSMEDRVGVAMTGAIVQRMSGQSGRLELIAGLTVDPEVGPLLLVGAGGTLTDLLADRVVRLPPRTSAEALDMLHELRCAPLLDGYRDQPALDAAAAADVLVALGALAADLPEVHELDINPLLLGRSGVLGLDVRIRVGEPTATDHAVRVLRS